MAKQACRWLDAALTANADALRGLADAIAHTAPCQCEADQHLRSTGQILGDLAEKTAETTQPAKGPC